MSEKIQGAELNSEAGRLFKAGDYHGAADCYQRAIAENDTVSTYFSNLSATHLKLNKYHAAQEAARRALILEPRSFKARYRRAMARKGLNLVPEALVDIAALLTADPENAQTRTEFAALLEIQQRTGMRPLEPDAIIALAFPHAHGSASNPPRPNLATDPHQMSLPLFFQVDPDAKPGRGAIAPGVIVSACMTCQVATNKKSLRTCAKCRKVNYCSVECQRSDWPMHKHTCGAAPDNDMTVRVGRNIHHHQFFQLHLVLYAVKALGPPKHPSEKHEFILMVVIDMVPLSPSSSSQNNRNRIAVKHIIPVPICILPAPVVEIHRGVVRGTKPRERLHCIWITTSGVYRPGEEDAFRVSVLAVQPFILNNIHHPAFSLDLYSHSFGVHRRVTPDLDFLFESINDELRLDVNNHYRLQA
ncbi:hypothetical protein DFH07DRAFT_237026 [Mycena maculata]|uniref:MYND-type domain-containing protein n=1 Tax=Mycena maculata TaxID=230809 RepID=A0AAD7MPK1_9AGAR|nr:hypothetical protein DFH07DRAFT_237026 [Mycena maculata]